jgi:hypothetical protein
MYGLPIVYFHDVLALYYVVMTFLLLCSSSNCTVVIELPQLLCGCVLSLEHIPH